MLLGFDIGGTKCAVTLGQIASWGEPTIIDKIALPTHGPAYDMIAALFAAADELLGKHGLEHHLLHGIGISCGGPLNSRSGTILSPPNLPGWDNIPIVMLAKEHFGIHTILQNDANAGAVAEWRAGAGKGYNNLVFLTFGTGMGSGLILDGRLYSGTNDMAGEAGHIRLADKGPTGYGKEGSFEGFCSGGGIAQLARTRTKEILDSGRTTSYCANKDQLSSLTAKDVADAAFSGDPVAIEIYKTCGHYLGKGLAVLVDILNPEVIVLGSIYCRAHPLLEPYMRETLEKEALHEAYNVCRIVPAALGERIGDVAALYLAEMASNNN
jgi:glucokinase